MVQLCSVSGQTTARVALDIAHVSRPESVLGDDPEILAHPAVAHRCGAWLSGHPAAVFQYRQARRVDAMASNSRISGLVLARCRQLHFINFLTPRPPTAAATREAPGRRTDAAHDGAAMSGVLGPRNSLVALGRRRDVRGGRSSTGSGSLLAVADTAVVGAGSLGDGTGSTTSRSGRHDHF